MASQGYTFVLVQMCGLIIYVGPLPRTNVRSYNICGVGTLFDMPRKGISKGLGVTPDCMYGFTDFVFPSRGFLANPLQSKYRLVLKK